MTPLPTAPTHLVIGPQHHGVNLYAMQLARALGHPVRWFASSASARDAVSQVRGTYHVHFTDALFGDDPASAAEHFEQLARACGRISTTLHDVPQESDGADSFARRMLTYRRVVDAVDTVFTNSHHEVSLLVTAGIAQAQRLHVVPLPIGDQRAQTELDPACERLQTDLPEIGIFGYVYPGKGHAEAIHAAANLPEPLGVAALGAIAPGHDDLDTALSELARQHGVPYRTTGFIPDADLHPLLTSIRVPVCLHQHISASGSMNSWIEHGRRPICLDSAYTREMNELRPGTLILVTPDEIDSTIDRARRDPGFTRLDPGTRLPHQLSDAAAQYESVFSGSRRPMISVIIPYYDAAEHRTAQHEAPHRTPAQRHLDAIFAAIRETAAPEDIEIIVADDGSAHAPRMPSDVTLVRQEDLGFRLAAARNLGASVARADVLVFLDGDTIPTRGSVERLAAPVREGVADLTVGKRLYGSESMETADVSLAAPESAWLAAAYAETDDLRATNARSYMSVIGAVLAVSRRRFREHPFDESFTRYGGEDWEFAYRIWQSGATFRRVADAVAVHAGPAWEDRDGRDSPRGRAEKNLETIALAPRIPAWWHRSPALLHPTPETVFHVRAHDPGESQLTIWVSQVLGECPDAQIAVPADFALPPLLASDPRVRRVGDESAHARYHCSVDAFDPIEDLAAVRQRLDERFERDTAAGRERRATVHTRGGRAVGELWSARAIALRGTTPRELFAAGPGPAAPSAPTGRPTYDAPDPSDHEDLERLWGRW